MSINPSDYDLDELRKIARERGGEANQREFSETAIGRQRGDDRPTDSANSFRAGLYRELLPLEAATDAEKPYLEALPEQYAAEMVVFEWLEFLLLHAGYQGAAEALEYYESVGWIGTECNATLSAYLLGLEAETQEEPSPLDVEDHLLSLVYVARLASMR